MDEGVEDGGKMRAELLEAGSLDDAGEDKDTEAALYGLHLPHHHAHPHPSIHKVTHQTGTLHHLVAGVCVRGGV